MFHLDLISSWDNIGVDDCQVTGKGEEDTSQKSNRLDGNRIEWVINTILILRTVFRGLSEECCLVNTEQEFGWKKDLLALIEMDKTIRKR